MRIAGKRSDEEAVIFIGWLFACVRSATSGAMCATMAKQSDPAHPMNPRQPRWVPGTHRIAHPSRCICR
jgi:hypothetical protein